MSESDETRVEEVPPHETTASPVALDVVLPRYFGVTPPTLLFGLATATLALAILLGALGHWVAALVLAAATLLEALLFLGVARRKPDTALARRSARASRNARERAAWLVEALSVRTAAAHDVSRLRRELLELAARREALLRALGAAVYAGDDGAATAAKEAIQELDTDVAERERRIEAIATDAYARLERRRSEVVQTAIRTPGDEE